MFLSVLCALSRRSPITASFCALLPGKQSSAPAFMRDSRAILFTECMSSPSTNSNMFEGLFLSLAAIISLTTASPTCLTPSRPYLMQPSSTEKWSPLVSTLGERVLIPMSEAFLMSTDTALLSAG